MAGFSTYEWIYLGARINDSWVDLWTQESLRRERNRLTVITYSNSECIFLQLQFSCWSLSSKTSWKSSLKIVLNYKFLLLQGRTMPRVSGLSWRHADRFITAFSSENRRVTMEGSTVNVNHGWSDSSFSCRLVHCYHQHTSTETWRHDIERSIKYPLWSWASNSSDLTRRILNCGSSAFGGIS